MRWELQPAAHSTHHVRDRQHHDGDGGAAVQRGVHDAESKRHGQQEGTGHRALQDGGDDGEDEVARDGPAQLTRRGHACACRSTAQHTSQGEVRMQGWDGGMHAPLSFLLRYVKKNAAVSSTPMAMTPKMQCCVDRARGQSEVESVCTVVVQRSWRVGGRNQRTTA